MAMISFSPWCCTRDKNVCGRTCGGDGLTVEEGEYRITQPTKVCTEWHNASEKVLHNDEDAWESDTEPQEQPISISDAQQEQMKLKLAKLQQEKDDKAAKAAERDRQRKREQAQMKQDAADKAALERRMNQLEQERSLALAQYEGQWILSKASNRQNVSSSHMFVGTDSAHISKDGVLTWAPSAAGKAILNVRPSGVLGLHFQDEEERSAHLVGDFEYPFLQRLRWNDGEVWARKGPSLEDYNGFWSRVEADVMLDAVGEKRKEFTAMAEIRNGMLTWADRFGSNRRPLELERDPGGALFARSGLGKVHWVILEEDAENPALQRLRWSDGDVWYRDATS